MDISLISAAIGSIKAAKDIGAGLLGVRDWNLVAEQVTRVNTELLKAQDALFAHKTQILGLQQQLLDTAQELAIAKETLAQRDSYALVELSPGRFAYRMNLPPKLGGPGDPGPAQRTHYVCQACLDNGRKVVLQFNDTWGTFQGFCTVCKATIPASSGFR